MYYLVIQNDFTVCAVGLFFEGTKKREAIIANYEASKKLVEMIELVLLQEEKTIHDMHYIMVNTGPAPYTALRTTIALINGIFYGTKIPLVPVDGIRALLAEHADASKPTLALINAFGNDVYYGLQIKDSLVTGCLPFIDCVNFINEHVFDEPLMVIGNGAMLFKDALIAHSNHVLSFAEPLPMTCSLQGVAQYGYSIIQNIPTQTLIHPLSVGYLKTYKPYNNNG